MKTNKQFDQAWRDLHVAYRSEDIDQLDATSERLNHAIRMMQLDREADEQDREDSVPLEPKARLKA